MGRRVLLVVVAFLLSAATSAHAQNQVFFLDFDSGNDSSIIYTSQMRDDVQAQMETIFTDFAIAFTQAPPPTGPFSRLTFNEGNPGGLAQDIDFRNLNKNDNAVINIDGLGVSGTANIVSASAIIGSHEGGHLLGLRHHDSFGAIGNGISPNVGTGNWNPTYPGPSGGIETNDHIMVSPAIGSSINDVLTPSWLSERSAIKLTYNEQGNAINESAAPNNSLGTAQAISLESFVVANTIISGQNAGIGDFAVDALAVIGTLDSGADTSDFYSFQGSAGDLINIEIITIADRLNGFDTTVSVFDSQGNFVDYYGTDAFNDDELEALDSQILDLFLTANDTYFIQVDSFSTGATGDYELFISNFKGVFVIPEPSSLALIALAGLGLGFTRRRRKA